ncbi:hypothetical protein [Vibrio owensii]|uniref:hypothetical protein n=1 Tax=Vibrio owensii TaxID=696485 RepID=UPI0005EF952E|nr:hypothetical protein [Vibrio owensii]
MVGFIGALSSSLCILILVFITLIVGYIDSLLPEASVFRIDEATYRYPISSYYVTDEVINELDIIIDDLSINKGFSTKSLEVGCSSGFDIDTQSANNLMVYNTIKTNNSLNLEALMNDQPSIDTNKLNYCYIDILGSEGSG